MTKLHTTNTKAAEGLRSALADIKESNTGGRFTMPTAIQVVDREAANLDLKRLAEQGRWIGDPGGLVETEGNVPTAALLGTTLRIRSGVPERLAWSIATELAHSTDDAIQLCGALRARWK